MSARRDGSLRGITAPTQLDFGKLPSGASPAMPALTITYSGLTYLVVSPLTLSGPFTVTGAGSCGGMPLTLTPGQSCTVQVTINVATSGVQTGVPTVQSNCPYATQVNPLAGMTSKAAVADGSSGTKIGFTVSSRSAEMLALLALLLVIVPAVRRSTVRAESRRPVAVRRADRDPLPIR